MYFLILFFLRVKREILKSKKLIFRIFSDYKSEKNDRIRKHNLKSIQKEGDATDTGTNFSETDNEKNSINNEQIILVKDRFDMILSIFSSRANSLLSKYELELAFLKNSKSKLNRVSGMVNFENFKNSSLLYSEAKELVTGKQSSAKGTVGGEGEKQIEIDKRLINNKIHFLNNKIKEIKLIKQKEVDKRKNIASILPTVALIGYTNSGKTAIMNYFTDAELSSRNVLFETLNTTIKK